ncbi:MAG: PD-(D/E)XK nuclease family protein, partial [Actinomycetota bacterium]|nr:PD-(D/E)XK nuclease family protein [Actinomycetota bacterium]
MLTDASDRLAPVADHPATEEALVAAYRELRELPEGTLGAVAATSATAAEVVRIHRLTRALLRPDWYDEEDLMAAAGDVIRGGGGASLLTPTIVYLPQRLSSPAAELLAAVAERVGTTVLFGVTG